MEKHAAKAATKAGNFDKAWGLFHEQKTYYAQHAAKLRWDAKHVLQLDGSVSEDLANILRLEKKHDQALVHILYWIITSLKHTKRQDEKLKAYLGRCGFESVSSEDVEKYIDRNRENPDYRSIQYQVHEWRYDSQETT